MVPLLVLPSVVKEQAEPVAALLLKQASKLQFVWLAELHHHLHQQHVALCVTHCQLPMPTTVCEQGRCAAGHLSVAIT